MGGSFLFSVIIDTYYRPVLLREAVEGLFRQTYDKLEIILVNNGATPETIEYLYEIEAQDKRVKLVHFKENQYRPRDAHRIIRVCYNAGLQAATGDYVFHQADDDLMADDYVEKMVALFKGNSECTTAAGIPVSIDIQGNVMDTGPPTPNIRPRYMPGHLVALDHLRGGTMFSAPGDIFTFKRDVLLQAGGFHVALELSHIYGIVPFGVTGFDETAVFYWRRHEGQLHKQLDASGNVFMRETLSLLKDWDIERRWQVFGPDVAKEVVTRIPDSAIDSAATWFVINLYHLRPVGSLRIACTCYRLPGFWPKIPGILWQRRREPFWPLLVFGKRVLRALFALLPPTASLPFRLQALRRRVTR